jgi:NB-ARC domain
LYTHLLTSHLSTFLVMNFQQLLQFLDALTFSKTQKHLKDIEVSILRGTWEEKKYEEIASELGYTDKYLKQDVGPKLWKLLSTVLSEKISKTNFRSAFERHYLSSYVEKKQKPALDSEYILKDYVSQFSEVEKNENHNINDVADANDLDLITNINQHSPISPESLYKSPLPATDILLQKTKIGISSLDNSIQNNNHNNILDTNINIACDWNDAPNPSPFYGRTEELITLKHLILNGAHRLVAILGMGGIGKTSLALKVAQEIQHNFEFVIWRSLRHAPSPNEILIDLIQFFSRGQETNLPKKLKNQLSLLLKYLSEHRCLIILDNMESIFQDGIHVGQYLNGYEGYGELLQRLGETHHQSSLIVTSREKPKEVTFLEGNTSSIYSLPLKGLDTEAGHHIFQARGKFFGISDQEWQQVFQFYAGNPLALKIVASAMQELSQGDMSELMSFLERGELQFENINDLLERQFKRLSPVEQEIIYWIAMNRKPISISELSTNIASEETRKQLFDGLASLIRRSLVERIENKQLLLLQPVVMEYVTEQFVLLPLE